MASLIDITGKRYGRLRAVREVPRLIYGGKKYRAYLCLCDCGKQRTVTMHALRQAHTRSCGFLNMDVVVEMRTRHGHVSRRNGTTPTYHSWSGMKNRCRNASNISYKWYGGKGVTVCDRWQGKRGFDSFLADMGEKPKGLTLDRIDPYGNYEPGNCRWATPREQRMNRRNAPRLRFVANGRRI